jgi:hypothetical protein
MDDLKDHFWKIVTSLWHLKTLEVLLKNLSDSVHVQIQAILDRAPHLNLLKFSSWMNPNIPIEKFIDSIT